MSLQPLPAASCSRRGTSNNYYSSLDPIMDHHKYNEDEKDGLCIIIDAFHASDREGLLQLSMTTTAQHQDEEEKEEKKQHSTSVNMRRYEEEEEEEEEEEKEQEGGPPLPLPHDLHNNLSSSSHPSLLSLPPPTLNVPPNDSLTVIRLNPPSLPPPKHHFISVSLPASITASPRSSSSSSGLLLLPAHSHHMSKIKKRTTERNHDQGGGDHGDLQELVSSNLPTHPAAALLSRQSTFGLSRFGLESYLLRSKSCGEGRASAPSDEFHLFSRRLSNTSLSRHICLSDTTSMTSPHQSRGGGTNKKNNKGRGGGGVKEKDHQYNYYKAPNINNTKRDGWRFKCGALMCMFLPAAFIGRGKRLRRGHRSRKDINGEALALGDDKKVRNIVISRTVSLEKFECGSWSSSAIIRDDGDDDDNVDIGDDEDHQEHLHRGSAASGGDCRSSSTHQHQNLYFDLPLELIQNYGNVDANNFPVTTTFAFDSNQKKGKAGTRMMMKKGLSSRKPDPPRTSHVSSSSHMHHHHHHQVRFSTRTSRSASPSSCITPRLRKARDDFNAFLQAQNVS